MTAHILRTAVFFAAVLSLAQGDGHADPNPPAPTPPRLMVQLGHAGGVTGARFSADGRVVITAAGDKTARVWDVATGRELVVLPHEEYMISAALSPDCRRAVTVVRDNIVRIWDTTTGKQIVVLKGHTEMAWQAEFFPDGKKVVTTAADKTARIWDAASGKELVSIKLKWPDTSLPPVVLSPDGKRLVTAEGIVKGKAKGKAKGKDGDTTKVWDATNGKLLFSVKGDGADRWWASFSRDGKRLLTRVGNTAHIYDADTGTESVILKGHTEPLRWAAFSPDGKKVVTASLDGTARVWDAVEGKALVKMTEHFLPGQPVPPPAGMFGGIQGVAPPNAVDWAEFSPDGKRVLSSAFLAGTHLIWDAENGKKLLKLFPDIGTDGVSLSPDGKKLLTRAILNYPNLWDASTGQRLFTLGGHAADVWSAAYSPAGLHLLSSSAGTPDSPFGKLLAWNVTSGKPPAALEGDPWYTNAGRTVFSPDGRRVLGSVWSKTLQTARVWDTATGKPVLTLKGHKQPTSLTEFSPDGRKILTWSSDGLARIWDAATGNELVTLSGATERISSARFSPDGKQLVTTGYPAGLQGAPDTTARIWDATTGKELQVLKGHGDQVRSGAFSPNGKKVVTASADGIARIWSLPLPKGKKNPLTLRGHNVGLTSAEFSPDGKWVVTASWDGTARIWDAASGNELRTIRSDDKYLMSASFSWDNKWVVTVSAERSVRIWDAVTGNERCQLVFFRDGTWAAVDPAGRYDASNGGDIEGMHWVVGLEPIALKQLKNRYYDPGLLTKILGLNKEPLRPVGQFADVKLYPSIELTPPGKGGSTATVRLTNQGGGIGRVVVLVNGKELLADARGPKPDPDAEEATISVNLLAAPNLIPGKPNHIEVLAYNAEGYLSSRGGTFDFATVEVAPPEPPHLHVIVCGISTYARSEINLTFAAKDAEDFAAAVKLAGERFLGPHGVGWLFEPSRVHVTLLSTSGKKGTIDPTKENIQAAFAAVAKQSKPGDILVVYLAGHGTTLPQGKDTYLYPTRSATAVTPEAFKDPTLLKGHAVTSEELTEWVKAIPANKQVLILDTCAAGALGKNLTEKRDVSGDQIRALDQLKDRTGFHVLMGCASDAVSYETTRYAQGLLTHSLLKGMKGAALDTGDLVDVAKLFSYATTEVPALAIDIGGVQKPLIVTPRGSITFPIGQLTAADKELVPLSLPRPLVLQSNFQDEVRLKDVLGVRELVDRQFRDLASVARGAKVVFVDAKEFPGALEVVGRYKVTGAKVTVTGSVYRGDQELSKFTVAGVAAKPEELAKQIVAEVEKQLPGK